MPSTFVDPDVELQNRIVFDAILDKTSGAGAGGGVGQQSQSTKDLLQRSKTYYSDPALAGGASQALAKLIGQQSQGYSEFVDNPTASPAYQNALSGMLAALVPGEQEGRRDLADVFRAAGNTASSSFGEAANKYQQGVDRNRMAVASDLLAKLYPQIAGAKFAPISQTNDLLNAMKLEDSQTQSREQSTSNPVNFNSGGPGGLMTHGSPGGGGAGFSSPLAPQQPAPPSWAAQGLGRLPKFGAGF